MTEKEAYEELVSKTQEKKIVKPKAIADEKDLFKALILAQLSDSTKEDLGILDGKKDYSDLLDGYEYKKILKEGNYKKFHDLLIGKAGKDIRVPALKKLAKASYETARYLEKTVDFDGFKKNLAEKTQTEEDTVSFLDRLHVSGIGLYFNKAARFFQENALLDVPYVDDAAKDYLVSAFSLPMENQALYHKLLQIAEANQICCYELNQRIAALQK